LNLQSSSKEINRGSIYSIHPSFSSSLCNPSSPDQWDIQTEGEIESAA
jgi:hypothetical protein